MALKTDPAYLEYKKMANFDNVGYFTSFAQEQNVLLDEPFELKSAFTDKMIEQSQIKMMIKIAMITGVSAGMGIIMAFFMSSFEFNSQIQVDTDRSTRSQLKQHFHGYTRFLKRNALHWAKFGFFIAIIEIPMELVVGKQAAPVSFVCCGLAGALQTRYMGLRPFVTSFIQTGCFVGSLTCYMLAGNDKS